MKTITTEKIPIKLWHDEIEDGAFKQVKNLANLPFAFHHIAIMPDNHQGYGMPIGGVLATKDVIIPNAVGVDIGCGMCAVKTSLNTIETNTLKRILGEIRNNIPLGFNHHKKAQDEGDMPLLDFDNYNVISREYDSALKQLGTLGGGNHFIELQKGSDGYIWIMIHSGSRNLGKKVADYYNKLAKELNSKSSNLIPKEYDLAYLYVDSDEGYSYIKEMNYCVEFAFANRKHMMEKIKIILNDIVGFRNIEFDPMINIAHNYAAMENHFGENVIVHRKGATFAGKNTVGIIPGSQGTKSYIVNGKGNPQSFQSCSHGAGRLMGRKEAQRKLNLDEEIKKLDEQGILHAIRGVKDLDEASGAYKPIEAIMKHQEDLVEIAVELIPLAVVKG